MSNVFLSFSDSDQAMALELADRFEQAGINVFMDNKDLYEGVKLADRNQWLGLQVIQVDHFVALASPEYFEAPNAALEWALKYYSEGKCEKHWFVPVQLREMSLPSVQISSTENIFECNWVPLYIEPKANWAKLMRSVLHCERLRAMESIDRAFQQMRSACNVSGMGNGRFVDPAVNFTYEAAFRSEVAEFRLRHGEEYDPSRLVC